MAIKKLTFSFDVPLTSLLGLIATGQADMRIDVLGDDKPLSGKALAAAGIAGLLTPPKHGNASKPRQRGVDASGQPKTALSAVLEALAQAADHTLPLTELRPIVAALGLSPSSANSQIGLALTKAWAVLAVKGVYRLTPAGLEECARRGFVPTKPNKKTVKPLNGATHHG